MSTPESTNAIEKLAEARARLSQITKELNSAHAILLIKGGGRRPRVQLQTDWAVAFDKFKEATDELTEVLRNLRGQIESE